MKKLTQKLINTFEKSDSVIERLTYALVKHGVPIKYFGNIASHGAQNGYPAISYYSDTLDFYNTNKDDIWELATDQSEDYGHKNVFEMLSGFSGAKNVSNCTRFENLMCWYATEEVSRHCVDSYKIPE